MKTVILIFISLSSFAQLQFGQTEDVNITAYGDVQASIKENGLNVGAEIELVNYWHFVKIGSQSFSVLQGGYNDVIMTNGINITIGKFKPIRNYIGFRTGLVFRNGETFLLIGGEAGINFPVAKNTFLGLRSTYDHRQDMKAFNWAVIWRFSGFVVLGIKI